MMQPMFPEGDWNVETLNGGEALVVVVLACVSTDVVVPVPPADVVRAALLADAVAAETLACCVTVTVFCDPPHPASPTATATNAPLFTERSLADPLEGVGSFV
jgi:hypothetical protein